MDFLGKRIAIFLKIRYTVFEYRKEGACLGTVQTRLSVRKAVRRLSTAKFNI